MRLDRLVASIGAEDSVVATTIGMSGRVRLTSGGALTIEADSPEALVGWLAEATAKAQLLVPAETAPEPTQRQVRYDELVVGDVLSNSGRTVTAPWRETLVGFGFGAIGIEGLTIEAWGSHLMWVDLPRPADQADDAAVTAATQWHDEIPWHDVIVGDEIRLAGEWLHVSSVGIDRVRRGNREVVAHPVPSALGVNRTVVSVEPSQTVTVRFPRSACTEAVAS